MPPNDVIIFEGVFNIPDGYVENGLINIPSATITGVSSNPAVGSFGQNVFGSYNIEVYYYADVYN